MSLSLEKVLTPGRTTKITVPSDTTLEVDLGALFPGSGASFWRFYSVSTSPLKFMVFENTEMGFSGLPAEYFALSSTAVFEIGTVVYEATIYITEMT